MNFFFVAGFDFGTSYSKVVIQDQVTKIQKVVTFGDDFGALLPSYLYVGEGWLSGPDGQYEGQLVSYPKLIASDAASGRPQFQSLTPNDFSKATLQLGFEDPQLFAAALLTRYFLSVINGIHIFLQEDEEWSTFDPAVDPLVIQVAVPSGLLQDKDRATENLMREALMAATSLHDRTHEISDYSEARDIEKAIKDLRSLPGDERELLLQRCITYPEVAAGVQPILQSRSVRDGKFITLDVGAGTIDLNVFHRWTRSEEHRTLDYWACQVKPYGFARLKSSGRRIGRREHETMVSTIKETALMDGLRSAVNALMKKAFTYQPYESSGDGPSPWAGESFAYIWGGGSEHPPYRQHFQTALQAFNIDIHTINKLPKPNTDLKLPDGVKFGRLAIAFGLSYYYLNLKEVRLPSALKGYAEQYGIKSTGSNRSMPEQKANEHVDCSCRGNPNCFWCEGSGLITKQQAPQRTPTPAPPKKKRTRPSRNATKPSKRADSSNQVPAGPAPEARSNLSAMLEEAEELFQDFLNKQGGVTLARIVTIINQIYRSPRESWPDNAQDFGLRAETLTKRITDHTGAWFLVQPGKARVIGDKCEVVLILAKRRTEKALITHQLPNILASSIKQLTGYQYQKIFCRVVLDKDKTSLSLVADPPDQSAHVAHH